MLFLRPRSKESCHFLSLSSIDSSGIVKEAVNLNQTCHTSTTAPTQSTSTFHVSRITFHHEDQKHRFTRLKCCSWWQQIFFFFKAFLSTQMPFFHQHLPLFSTDLLFHRQSDQLRLEPSRDRPASKRATVPSHDCSQPVTNSRPSLESVLRKPERKTFSSQ